MEGGKLTRDDSLKKLTSVANMVRVRDLREIARGSRVRVAFAALGIGAWLSRFGLFERSYSLKRRSQYGPISCSERVNSDRIVFNLATTEWSLTPSLIPSHNSAIHALMFSILKFNNLYLPLYYFSVYFPLFLNDSNINKSYVIPNNRFQIK